MEISKKVHAEEKLVFRKGRGAVKRLYKFLRGEILADSQQHQTNYRSSQIQ